MNIFIPDTGRQFSTWWCQRTYFNRTYLQSKNKRLKCSQGLIGLLIWCLLLTSMSSHSRSSNSNLSDSNLSNSASSNSTSPNSASLPRTRSGVSVTLEFQDAPVSVILQALADYRQLNLITTTGVGVISVCD